MNPLPIIALGITAAGAATGAFMWLNRRSQGTHNVDPERFVLEAAEGQWADMETAQLALDTSRSAEVQFFAQLVLDIDLANFARQGLEKIREHQKMSAALIAHLRQADAGGKGHSPAPQNSSMTQVTGSDTHLAQGVPQQTRGGATNPHH